MGGKKKVGVVDEGAAVDAQEKTPAVEAPQGGRRARKKRVAKVSASQRHAPPIGAAFTDDEREALLALQDKLGLPPGTRPGNEEECRRVIAHHEAGHAVVGHLLGRKLRAVSVMQHCDFEPLSTKRTTSDLENSIKIALAGPHAEVRASPDEVSVGAGADIPRAREEAEEIAGEGWWACLDALSVAAQTLVMEHWSAIETVAAELVKPARVLRETDLLTLLK